MVLTDLFELAGGSITGTSHVFSHRGNQDAFYFAARENLLAGVICDGCGSSPYSEVGAHIGARTLLSNFLSVTRIDRDWLEILRQHTLEAIETLAIDMCGQEFGSKGVETLRPKHHEIIRDYFLFTVVGFAITPTKAWFFSIGDGNLWVNGEQTPIGPFENNAPPYMAYALLDSSLLSSNPGCLKFQIKKELPTECLESFLIGCDGVQEFVKKETTLQPNQKCYVGNIAQFWENDHYHTNPCAIDRKLFLTNKESSVFGEKHGGLLYDDTTLIVGRRKYKGTASVCEG